MRLFSPRTLRGMVNRTLVLIRQSRKRTPVAQLPGYLRPDAQRAHRLGVSVQYHPRMSTNASKIGFHSNRFPYTPFARTRLKLGGKGSRVSVLGSLRHEVGHKEVRMSPHDLRRLRQAGHHTNPKKAALRTRQRDEMLAWKNAIRASKTGRVGLQDMWEALHGYHPPTARRASGPPSSLVKDYFTLRRYQRMIRRPGFRAHFQKKG